MSGTYCTTCGREYKTQLLLEIAMAKFETQALDAPVDSSGGSLGPGLTRSLRASGYVTLGDLRDAGDDLLAVNGVGPYTLNWIGEWLDDILERTMRSLGVTTTPSRSA